MDAGVEWPLTTNTYERYKTKDCPRGRQQNTASPEASPAEFRKSASQPGPVARGQGEVKSREKSGQAREKGRQKRG